MPFAYYDRLSPGQKKIYRASDAVSRVVLPRAGDAAEPLGRVERALSAEDRRRLLAACADLADAIHHQLGVPPVEIRVLAARPSRSWGELQGLYEPETGAEVARITVWMRTARKKQVVAFRTFLRTLLHEICHHLDYELLHLADSFHTEGFFKRESSLFNQLVQASGDQLA